MEEILFKNTSKLTEEDITFFQNIIMKKKILFYSLFVVLFCAGLGVGLLFVHTFLGVAIMVCGFVGGGFLLPYLLKDGMKKQNELYFKDKKYLNHFEFYEEYFKVTSEVSTKESKEYKSEGSESLYYQDIYKVVEYKSNVFIYLNKKESYILDKKGMEKGVVSDLIELFKNQNIKIVDKKSVSESIKTRK